jgi:Raf kinase inhibitor-like YbhB/YbcL family protein
MKIFYSPSYTIAGHSFDTTRKSRWIAESLAREPITGIELVAPEPTSAATLSHVHDPEYVDAVRSGNPRELAESQGFPWDPALGNGMRLERRGHSCRRRCPPHPPRFWVALKRASPRAASPRSGDSARSMVLSSPPVRRSTQAPAPWSSLISTRIAAAVRMSSSRATVHWVVYNMPPDTKSLPENASKAGLPQGALVGLNDFKKPGYGGPCPPIGRHRYFHKLYALDITLDLKGATKSQIEQAMRGHVLANAELVGTYQKGDR